MQMRILKIRTQAKFQAFCTTFAFSYSNLLCSLGAMPAESDAHLHIWYRQWLINLKIHLSRPRYAFGFLTIQAVLPTSFLVLFLLPGCPFSACLPSNLRQSHYSQCLACQASLFPIYNNLYWCQYCLITRQQKAGLCCGQALGFRTMLWEIHSQQDWQT